MKKIFLTTGLLSILSAPALAEVKWFVGGGMGYALPVYSEDVYDLIDDHYYEDNSGTVSFNLTGGMRFGEYEKIYNGGVSATYSYMLELGKLENDYKNPVHMDDVFDFSSLYITYDNYIRVSGESQYRTDFVASFGFGMGWMSEDLNNKKYKDETLAFVMKLGFTGETVVEGLGWDAGLSIFALDVEDNEKLQGAVSFDIGVKYTF